MENKVLAEKFRLATGFRIDVDQLLAEPDKAATFRRVVWTMPVGVKMVYPGAYVYNIIKDCVNSFAQALGLDVESAKRALEVDGQYSVRDEVFIKMLDSEYVPGGGNNDDDEPTEVRVTAVKVQGYTVGTTLPMKPEATYQLVIEVVPENATDKTAVWTSSDESVVVVDEDGLVTAVGEGNANIVVTVGGKSKTVKFAVHYPSVESFSLSSNQIQLECGQTQQLSVIVVPEDAKYDSVQWRSSNRNVATVDENGLVTMVSNDKDASAVITATINGRSTQCAVSVIEKYIDVESVSLSEESLELVEGESHKLTVTVEPENATNKTVVWSSSDNAIATVSNNGTVRAVGEGRATITATADAEEAKCRVIVEAKQEPEQPEQPDPEEPEQPGGNEDGDEQGSDTPDGTIIYGLVVSDEIRKAQDITDGDPEELSPILSSDEDFIKQYKDFNVNRQINDIVVENTDPANTRVAVICVPSEFNTVFYTTANGKPEPMGDDEVDVKEGVTIGDKEYTVYGVYRIGKGETYTFTSDTGIAYIVIKR